MKKVIKEAGFEIEIETDEDKVDLTIKSDNLIGSSYSNNEWHIGKKLM